MKKQLDSFEIKTTDLGYSNIEEILCDYCNLHNPCSSNFTALEVKRSQDILILTEDGSLSCRADVYKLAQEDGWEVYFYYIEVHKSRS